MKVVKLEQKAINKVVEVLKQGGVVVFPTDTVYGFLADAENKKAVEKIFKIKKRPRSKLLPVFIKDLKMAKKLAEIDEPTSAKASAGKQEKILKKYWPGKYTFILNKKKTARLYGVDKDKIALRIPKYKFLNDLLKKINKPLVQTSVNISGQPSLTRISDIIKEFEGQKNKPDLIISAGNLPKVKPSTIIDLTKSDIKIIRK